MNDLYRGYEIKPVQGGGFTWTDERNFQHWQEGVTKVPYPTAEAAMDGIDAYKRNMARGTS